MRMSEKCHNNKNNNFSDNPLTSRRTDGSKNRCERTRTYCLRYIKEHGDKILILLYTKHHTKEIVS